MISHADLIQRFWYDEEGGRFYVRSVGRICGTIHQSKNGKYRRIWIDGVRYFEHNLAWFYMTGEKPKGQIDHRDRDGLNNKWDNLRDIPMLHNQANKGVYKNNKLGVRGVRLLPSGRYNVKMRANKKEYHIGNFRTLEQAKAAREAFEIKMFGEKFSDNDNRGDRGGQRQQGQHSIDHNEATVPARHSLGTDDAPRIQPKRVFVEGYPDRAAYR